jgi:hypothetical protein
MLQYFAKIENTGLFNFCLFNQRIALEKASLGLRISTAGISRTKQTDQQT